MIKFAAICNVWFAKMANLIQHQGIVESISGSQLTVRIIQSSACSGCHAKGYCSSADSKEKVIDIIDASAASYQVGERVMVMGEMSMGMKAVVLAFVIPFFILVISLFVCVWLTGDELLAGTVSLSLLVPYYLIIWICKARLKQKFSFTIKPIK